MKPLCPTCKKALSRGLDTPTLPFCSSRCKLADLGSWLSGSYVVASDAPLDESELSEADLAALIRDREPS